MMTDHQIQHLQDRHARLVEATAKLRFYQARAAATRKAGNRCSQDEHNARHWENVVDRLLGVEKSIVDSKQGQIF